MKLLLRYTHYILLSVIVCTLAIGHSALAVSDQFIVAQSVIGADTTAPSIPGNVIATGISTTEIDLTWDASTDNVGVTGYQVFRDGAQIATSVATSYSDNGLAPATSYDYTITAFDNAGNISTSSATTTGTTNSIPTTDPIGGGGAPEPVVPRMLDFTIEVTEYSAHLSWRTNIPTRSEVSWGETQDYEIASLSESVHLSFHATELSGLTPGVEYKYKILARERGGRETVLKEGSFVTTALPDAQAPPNVRNFRGYIAESDAVLTWQNPDVSDFAKVRIVRKESGYPRDPFDGTLVYEGNKEEFRDLGAFRKDGIRHYALFTYDTRGNDSSGAVLRLERRGGMTSYEPKKDDVVVDLGTAGVRPLGFSDLIFEQGGHVVSYIGEQVPLDATKAFSVKIPYERLPEHLKTILVTFRHPTDRSLTFSFILRANEDKTFYEATIDSLGDEGQYGLSLSVLDFEERTVSKVVGVLAVSTIEPVVPPQKPQSFLEFLFSKTSTAGLILGAFVLFLLLVVLYFLAKKRQMGTGGATTIALKMPVK